MPKAPPPPPPQQKLLNGNKGPSVERQKSPASFEPPPFGCRPEIKIPPNPMASLRPVPKPKPKDDFWVEEYRKERSKSPMVQEGEGGSCAAPAHESANSNCTTTTTSSASPSSSSVSPNQTPTPAQQQSHSHVQSRPVVECERLKPVINPEVVLYSGLTLSDTFFLVISSQASSCIAASVDASLHNGTTEDRVSCSG